jgi:hypothetical protein
MSGAQRAYVKKLFAAQIKFLKGSSPLKTYAYISRKAGDWFSVPLAGLGARAPRSSDPPWQSMTESFSCSRQEGAEECSTTFILEMV